MEKPSAPGSMTSRIRRSNFRPVARESPALPSVAVSTRYFSARNKSAITSRIPASSSTIRMRALISFGFDRQAHGKNGARPIFALHGYVAAVGFNDLAHEAQAEPAAADLRGLGGGTAKEWFENIRHFIFRNAGTVISNLHLNFRLAAFFVKDGRN